MSNVTVSEARDATRAVFPKGWRGIVPRSGSWEALAAFMDRYAVDKPSKAKACIQRLKGRRCGLDNPANECPKHDLFGYWAGRGAGHGSLTDHVTLWLRDGEPVVWVSQPYHVDAEKLCLARKALRVDGLTLEIGAPATSWWAPGETYLLTVQPVEEVK